MHSHPSIPEVYRANSSSNILSNDNKRIKQFNKHINGDLVNHNNHNFNNINQINTITQQNLHHQHHHQQQHQQHQHQQHHKSAINLNTFNLNKQQQQQNCINNNYNNNHNNNTTQKNEEIHKNFAYDKNNYLLWFVTPVAAR